MASNKLRLQSFRTNDLVKDGGKQFELGKSWCDDFFEFDKTLPEVVVNLKFKAIQMSHVPLNDKIIELRLADVSIRGDRKAYVNGNNGMSQIKDFFINDLHLNPENNLTDYFAIYKVSEFDYYLYFVPSLLYKNFLQFFKSVLPTVSINHNNENLKVDGKCTLQQIFYGAPGTGKSNTIKRAVDDQGKICFRTTFHPDSDYSTFVGCYKPTMKRSTITKDGVTTREEKIVYRFEPQAFTNAYVQAWNSKEEVYLVIEEINRGNCAQIFGDLFQLLDRKNGESEYPINADTALADYLQVALADSNRDDIPVEVKNGMKLKLPSNLYIWATMNTSDQSLFPIDSAFKRRWDWIYIPIKQHDEGYRIKIDTVTYDWWGFLEKINQVIGDATSSEDKKLGYFFVKAEDKGIGADKFVSKVLFYLWNDVFKNYGFDNPIFSRGENKKFAFSDFFTKEGTPETSMVNQFLRKLDETIDKENSFEKIPDVNDAPSSLMVKYNGESIEGTSARNKYVELVKLVVAEKGGEQVANCIGAELTRTPAEGSTRMYKPIGDTGWYLATNNGIDAIKKNINKIKEALGADIEIE